MCRAVIFYAVFLMTKNNPKHTAPETTRSIIKLASSIVVFSRAKRVISELAAKATSDKQVIIMIRNRVIFLRLAINSNGYK